jgi:outer membrane PBP1 activator LpoA protein
MKRFIRSLRVLALGLLLAGCTKEPSEDITFDKSRTPDEVFTDFVTQESDSGLTQWKLTAPKGSRFKEKKLVVLERPTIVLDRKSTRLNSSH